MAVHPVAGMLPAQVAEMEVMALATPVVTVGAVLTPDPLAATLMFAAPPPPTTMFPL